MRRVFLFSAERPYRCPSCGGRSRIARSQHVPLLILSTFIICTGGNYLAPRYGGWAIITFAVLWISALVLLLTHCRFEPISESQPRAQQ